TALLALLATLLFPPPPLPPPPPPPPPQAVRIKTSDTMHTRPQEITCFICLAHSIGMYQEEPGRRMQSPRPAKSQALTTPSTRNWSSYVQDASGKTRQMGGVFRLIQGIWGVYS